MAYPPPPGHASLPSKPPPSSHKPSTNNGSFKPAFTAFAPRNVATTPRTNSPAQYSSPAVTNHTAQAAYTAPSQPSYQAQPQYDSSHQAAHAIRNPFVASTTSGATSSSDQYGSYDPEYEAQLQQWQSAYTNKEDKSGFGQVKSTAPPVKVDASAPNSTEVQKTVQREGGGTKWTDSTLLEWDPAHFRIFVGNLAGEVTDESLLKAFAKYSSVQKARVIRDKRTTKSKGYGFVSFANGDDYFQAARDMQGKYIGSHPVLIKRAMTEVKPTTVQNKNNKNKQKGRGGVGAHEKVDHGGIQKKAPKTKGGLRVLG